MSVRCVVLTGGVGGAKLTLGLSHIVRGAELAAVVNTGDDFQHLGLRICPDIDTLTYTLADCVNTESGWGRRDETWQCMAALKQLGGDSWFQLGDRDLAMHLARTGELLAGSRLTEVTRRLCRTLGIETRVLPASDEPIATRVHTDEGVLPFQEYFVRRRAEPRVQSITFDGAAAAVPTPEVRAALADPGLEAILIAPSNPYLSIDPLLAIPGLNKALGDAGAPVIAVSPIVGGRALKGPTAKIMAELGLTVSAAAVARHYQRWIDGFILDTVDEATREDIEALGITVHCCDTIMRTLRDRMDLAHTALEFVHRCQKQSR